MLWTIPTIGLLITSFRPEGDINSSGWWTIFTNPAFTLDNYDPVLNGPNTDFATYFVNSIVITIPAVLIPVSIATMAAYAFAWMKFPGRDFLFVAVFALQIVPIQVTMIPLLSLYVDLGPAGSDAPGGGFYTIWLSHSIFALPLAIYLLHNFMSQIPGELIESARVDGAGHVQIFSRIMLPLMAPAIAAFGIFQFLWVWNDLLVALVFGGGSPEHLAADRAPGGAVRHPRAGLVPALGRRVRVARGAADRLPVAAALLRARAAGRQRQGLSGGRSRTKRSRCAPASQW